MNGFWGSRWTTAFIGFANGALFFVVPNPWMKTVHIVVATLCFLSLLFEDKS